MFREKRKPEVKKDLPITNKCPDIVKIPETYQSDELKNIEKELGDIIRISPIVFTSIGNNRNFGLYDLPLQISQAINFKISGDKERLTTLTNFQLNGLGHESNMITEEEMTHYIIQNTFMSFCSLIDQCDLSSNTKILTYLPIKQMVYEEIEKKFYDIRTNFGALLNTFSLSTEINFKHLPEEERQRAALDNAISVGLSIRDIILQILVDAICFGTDKAINDILMQVHTVPNINEIYLEISRYFNIREFEKSAPEAFSTICTVAIKNYIREQIIILIGRNLIPSIEELVSRSFYILSNVYDDHYFSIKEIEKSINKASDDVVESLPFMVECEEF